MKPIRFLLAPALVALSTLPALADKLPLATLSGYLNGLKKVRAEFTQINADGTISTGVIYISRPYKARFEYNPPTDALVVVGGQQVAIFDGKSNTGPEQYPLKQTPLNLILARKVNLAATGMVTGHSYDGTTTTVTAQDPKRPEIGTIQLMFTDPAELRQWVITNEAGDQTTVILGRLESVPSLSGGLFSIESEIARRSR